MTSKLPPIQQASLFETLPEEPPQPQRQQIGVTQGSEQNSEQDSEQESAQSSGLEVVEAMEAVKTPRLWSDRGWTARVIKNEDDDGWAVAMIKDGESEPALVGPWTMGRDKKNPKPLDAPAFHTLIKTANEVLRRHEQQLHATLHKHLIVAMPEADIRVTLDIVPDEDNPYAILRAQDADSVELAQVRVAADFKLSQKSATAWIENDFRRPG